MKGHGNLNWDFSMGFRHQGDTWANSTSITVRGYDWADAYTRAKNIYDFMKQQGASLYSFTFFLRDDGMQSLEVRPHEIFCTYFASDEEKFFERLDTAWQYVWRN